MGYFDVLEWALSTLKPNFIYSSKVWLQLFIKNTVKYLIQNNIQYIFFTILLNFNNFYHSTIEGYSLIIKILVINRIILNLLYLCILDHKIITLYDEWFNYSSFITLFETFLLMHRL